MVGRIVGVRLSVGIGRVGAASSFCSLSRIQRLRLAQLLYLQWQDKYEFAFWIVGVGR